MIFFIGASASLLGASASSLWGGRLLHFNDHLGVDISVAHHGAELFKVDLPVVVLVVEEDGLVHNLLELGVLQVVAHHHLQNLEQLAVGDVSIIVNVVDSEGEFEFGLHITLGTEVGEALDELFEVDLSVTVVVKYVDHTPD